LNELEYFKTLGDLLNYCFFSRRCERVEKIFSIELNEVNARGR
jgi:hypothetical protein